MASKRYYIALLPFEHINGKMEQVSVIAHDTETPEVETGVFYYGYKHRSAPTISRFGLRKKGRDLIAHPYTTNELSSRQLFTQSLSAVNTHHEIAGDWELMMADFNAQKKYRTPIGYAVAQVRKNGGVWLEDWTS